MVPRPTPSALAISATVTSWALYRPGPARSAPGRVWRADRPGGRGHGRRRGPPPQEDQLAALGLVLDAVVLWNTRYLDAIVEHLRGSGASAATPSPPSRQQSYDRCATRTHVIARTTANSDVTVRGSPCGDCS
jgi:Tn3 transposase DDE domain